MAVLEQTQPQVILSHIVSNLILTELYRTLIFYLCALTWITHLDSGRTVLMRVLSCCAVLLVLVCADGANDVLVSGIVARIATNQGVVPSAARRVPHDARSPDASRAKIPVEQRACDQTAGGRSEQRGVRVRRCLDRCCAGRLRSAVRGHRALRARWTVPRHQEDQRSATARRLRAPPTPRRRPEGPENLPGW